MTGHFSEHALAEVQAMFAEGQISPLQGQCNQKEKRKAQAAPRTAAQEQADQARAQANRGQDNIPSATRSEAARKGAETRKKCRTGQATPKPPTPASPATA